MAEENQPVPVGSLLIDCSAMASFIVDLAPGERQGKRTTQRGYDEAVGEIMSNQAELGRQVGITAEEVQALERTDQRVAQIDAHLPAARKLVELLEETRAVLDDERHRQVVEIAALVDARSKARRSTTLFAAYQKTRAYRSAIGLKIWRSRRRNAAAAAMAATAHEPAAGTEA